MRNNKTYGVESKKHFNEEMLSNISALIPFTPIEIVRPIHEFWSSSKEMTEKALRFISLPNPQKPQVDN